MALLAEVASGQGQDNKPATAPAAQADAAPAKAAFSANDREMVRQYCKGLPRDPGAQANVPPEFQSSLEPGTFVTPAMLRRFHRLPKTLEAKLTPLADYYERGILDNDVVIVDRRSKRVQDVIHDPVRP